MVWTGCPQNYISSLCQFILTFFWLIYWWCDLVSGSDLTEGHLAWSQTTNIIQPKSNSVLYISQKTNISYLLTLHIWRSHTSTLHLISTFERLNQNITLKLGPWKLIRIYCHWFWAQWHFGLSAGIASWWSEIAGGGEHRWGVPPVMVYCCDGVRRLYFLVSGSLKSSVGSPLYNKVEVGHRQDIGCTGCFQWMEYKAIFGIYIYNVLYPCTPDFSTYLILPVFVIRSERVSWKWLV